MLSETKGKIQVHGSWLVSMSKLTKQMQHDWNRRAKVDAMHYIWNRKPIDEWTLTEWQATGEDAVVKSIDTLSIDVKKLTCLEIGCGAGRLTQSLSNRFRWVIALDVSDEMLRQAEINISSKNVTYFKGNGNNLKGIDDNSIDMVFSVITLQHIPDLEIQYQYIREAGRVLSSGGWFYIQVYANRKHATYIKEQWHKRAEADALMGWSEAARTEFEKESWRTWMQTAVDNEPVYNALKEGGLRLQQEEGHDTDAWVLIGTKE